MRSWPRPPFWAPLDASNPPLGASKTPPNRFLFRIRFSMPSWIEFWSIFDPNMAPTWPSKSTKIHEKSMPRCLPILISFSYRFFCWFLFFFCFSFDPLFQLKSSPLLPNRVHGFQVGSKNRSKIYQKSLSTWEGLLASIFHGFWSILEAKMEPSWKKNQ